MSIGSESLFFEDHLRYHRELLCETGSPKSETLQRAWYSHALAVLNPLMDISMEVHDLISSLSSISAINYLILGAGRRLISIWYAYNDLIKIVEPRRKAPLNIDEMHLLSNHLNLIYTHIRGAMDNYAWAYCQEKEPELLKDKNGKSIQNVGLFNPKMWENSKNKNLCNQLNSHSAWAKELTSRRDPVSHRIPLAVISGSLTSLECQELMRLNSLKNLKESEGNLDEAMGYLQALTNIGEFIPKFSHDPSEEAVDIYPTVPNDIVNLISIHKIVSHELKEN